ncbi:MAG: kinase to dihydroxyacetone kinase [Clostridia bacterium]|nr:kinase to dihydroxyacetone kinase [Clostridia bacterium]
MDYVYDTQLLIEGKNLNDSKIIEYINGNIEGDCLLVVGDDELIKIHFHTNTPWKVLEYCASLGEVYDVVIENMVRQAIGLQG